MRKILCAVALAATTFALVNVAYPQQPVLQRGYDPGLSGANLTETTLTASNVNPTTFGRVFTLPVDDRIYAQPLYVPQVSITGQGIHNVVYVATMSDTLYAFDADAGGQPLWEVNFASTVGALPVPFAQFTFGGNTNIVGNNGILSTPVIDPATNIMYLVACTLEAGTMVYRLHAVNIADGSEPYSNAVISASYGGVTFDAAHQNQRASLTLSGNQVVFGFAAIEAEADDLGGYTGWVMAYNKQTLVQTGAFATVTTGTEGGGVWQSGRPPVVDGSGYVYVFTGNGYQSGYNGVNDFSETALKLNPASGLALVDWFTPSNWASLDSADDDLSSSGPLLIPNTSPSLLAGGGKQGVLYVLNTTNMGKNTPSDSKVVQEETISASSIRGGPVYWQRSSANGGPLLYDWGASDWVKAYAFNGATFSTSPTFQGSGAQIYPGGILALSANGEQPGTGVLWATVAASGNVYDDATDPGVLYAFDADNVATQLYSSTTNSSRDNFGNFAKFVPPLVVNGKVYVATFSNQVAVYGLLNPSQPQAATPTFSPAPGTYTGTQQVTLSDTTSGALIYYTTNGTTPTTSSAQYVAGSPLTVSATETIEAMAVASGYTNSAVASGTYTISAQPVAATPTFSPAPGTYTGTQQVTLSDTTSGALIYYTTNGTTPTTSSAQYVAGTPLTVSATETIEAMAVASGYTNSAVASGTYTISTSGTTPTSVNLSSEDNVVGTGNVGTAVIDGGMDGGGCVYAANLLGTSLTWSGSTFAFGSADAVDAVSNTTVALPAGNYSTVTLLATGVNGGQANQKFVVTYTDGTTTTITQSLSDWFSPQSYAGESIVSTMAYRITQSGAADNRTFYLYGYSFAINSAKTVASMTLPANRDVVVLAIDLVGSSSLPVAATPTFSPAPGSYTGTQQVTLSDTTSGALIYYTTNGTTPTISSAQYVAGTPIAVSATETIEAMAVASGYANSTVASGTYTISAQPTAATPTFSPAPGTYTGTQQVTLSDTTSGAVIYYTTNGTTPTTSSTQYVAGSPLTVSATETIEAMAVASGYTNSAVASGTYTISAQPVAATPTFSPAPGTYTGTQQVTLSDTTSGALIYYTINGTTPTTSSAAYVAGTPLTVSATETIEAMAVASGYANSAVASGTYTISTSGTTPTSVNLSSEDNVVATGNVGTAVIDGGLDGGGCVYAANLLGTSLTWSGSTFALGSADAVDAVSNATVALPAGNYSTVTLLATGFNGGQANQKFVVTYTDGTTTTITQSLSDWFSPQSYAGESIVSTMAYRITQSGAADNRTFYLYGYSFAINSAKTVASMTLPANRDVVVLAIDLVGSSSLPVAATPTFSPAPGSYTGTQQVTLSDTTSGALIYYTTNGTTPTISSAQYVAGTPIAVSATETIEAMAVASGYANSTVASATYTISAEPTAATPTFSPAPGTYTGTQQVTLSDTTSGAVIYYTTNGTTPTTSSAAYAGGSLTVSATETIEAMAVASGYTNSTVASGTYTISAEPAAATPTFSPAPGTYTGTQQVTLSDTTSGALIYYTTNGTTPTTSSAQYVAGSPLTVSATETIEAMAVASGYTNSAVASGTYTISAQPVAATPAFSPAPGTYTGTQQVTLSDTTSGALIYYTTNGTTPTTSSAQYVAGSPLTVSATETIEAMAVASGYTNSAVASGTYTISAQPVAATPTFSPAPGTYTGTQQVTLSDTTSGALIYYTTNGTTPTTSSAQYVAGTPLTVSATETIEAMAVASGYTNSAVASGTYTISTSGTTPTSVNLSSEDNVVGTGNVGTAVIDGGMDGGGCVYAANLLGTSLTWSGSTFAFGSADAVDAVSNTTVALPAGNYSTVTLLATGVNGGQANQKFVVTYTDGTTTTITQSLSDWFSPQSYAGESIVSTMAYRITQSGAADNRTFYLYGYSFAINSAKTVASMTLPANRDVVVLAIDLVGSSSLPVAATPTFSPAPGSYTGTQQVTLSDTTSGALIYYTTNGTTPTISSAQYVAGTPIAVSATETIEAMAVASGYANSTVASGTYTISAQPTAATPTFSPAPGSYTGTQQVTLSDTTSGALIYYTTNGTTPTTSSTQYVAGSPLTVSATETIEAMAVASGYANSTVASGTYTISAQPVAATPTFSPAPGSYTGTQQVTLSDTTSGALIYYTTNGTTPTTSSAAYVAGTPISVSATETIEAMAVASGYANSTVASGTYTISAQPVAATPMFSPAPGSYTGTQQVTLSDTTSGALIYYTTNGTTPTTSSAQYVAGTPLTVSATETIEAMAVASGYTNSAVASGTYTISTSGTTPTSVNLSSEDNVVATGNVGTAVIDGGLDGGGCVYAANLLGTSLTWSGSTFALGSADAVDAVSNTTVALPAGNYSTVTLLATGFNGGQANQKFVVTYTDGTTTTITQSLSDWFSPQSYAGESIVSTMAYRITQSGAADNRTFYLYGYSFAINSAKTVASMTLPANRDVVVLAIDLSP